MMVAPLFKEPEEGKVQLLFTVSVLKCKKKKKLDTLSPQMGSSSCIGIMCGTVLCSLRRVSSECSVVGKRQ